MSGCERHFDRFRDRWARVLQIGGDGRFTGCFPRGSLVRAEPGDTDPDGMFDVVLGGERAITSFHTLFARVTPDGLYVIEEAAKTLLGGRLALADSAITGISVQDNIIFIHKGQTIPARLAA